MEQVAFRTFHFFYLAASDVQDQHEKDWTEL